MNQQFLWTSSRTQLNTHTCYSFWHKFQMLHKVKNKKRRGVEIQSKNKTKRQRQVQKTLLRKKEKKRVKLGKGAMGVGKRKKQNKKNQQQQLADSSPLHTPVVSRRCSEDEEGQEQRWDVCFVKAVEQAQTSGFRSTLVFSEYAWAQVCFSSTSQLG